MAQAADTRVVPLESSETSLRAMATSSSLKIEPQEEAAPEAKKAMKAAAPKAKKAMKAAAPKAKKVKYGPKTKLASSRAIMKEARARFKKESEEIGAMMATEHANLCRHFGLPWHKMGTCLTGSCPACEDMWCIGGM